MANTELDLDSILQFAIKLALDAGQIIREGQEKRFASENALEDEKANSVDLVTEVDKAVEKFIVERIRKTYPSHKFIGEESYEGQQITDEPTWIVDPIDGTTNFVHGFPMVATSIGLAHKGVPVVGVIYNPFLDQLWSAAKGRGAYLNQKRKLPITGSSKPLASLGQALIGVEYGMSRSPPALPRKVATFEKLTAHTDVGGKMCHSLRSMGSAALNIVLVASGGLDMYWEVGAGICILEESGGRCFGGKTADLSGEVDAKLMAGRKYLVIRGIRATNNETSLDQQKKFAKEFYDCVEDFDP
ncbi:myo-inositol-1(or 4)-monophosphatase [Cryptococcus deuterogattii 99/473]|uniref:Inositol-1-monophosphatase n=1 Tax=Cryptococcus deuterogattii Ram5 TaxID=1296110 RepID=A0A0D0TBV0_9TREE|nr:myo-inositol-1(or 4)-monophosphatase [Cryptococcus deuterogattii MMRL2647]KIR43547.1 myo-inositol-1(or 4)-monophosphatase [Cryptococcus deuterogattii Ram5]KIR74880.1 myo-inositol-1(or 4)-monophosphatase [Cryptococcus deuterogattii CA1014]KIS01359.1 myo-inositol-1(or 4)-monophosphatase [Cryptococcus deuterogattii 2001/935-1]KIY57037.1 myo-inositol-1(or 4)-monophosphatase [Cryptococcus deuterogattii 99/473]